MAAVGFSTLVSGIASGDPAETEAAYSKLMDIEQNTLRVVERVADDARDDAVRGANAWETPVAGLAQAFAKFWGSMYASVMEGEYAAVKSRLTSADGYFYSGGLLLMLVVVFLVIVAS
jgi:hypothetical protein